MFDCIGHYSAIITTPELVNAYVKHKQEYERCNADSIKIVDCPQLLEVNLECRLRRSLNDAQLCHLWHSDARCNPTVPSSKALK
jgi:hypothetical protein